MLTTLDYLVIVFYLVAVAIPGIRIAVAAGALSSVARSR